MSQLTLVLGGARSGKSRFALELGNKLSGKKLFIATAQALDPEMVARITRHQKERGEGWQTLEVSQGLGRCLASLNPDIDFVLIDCLTLWLSNLLMEDGVKDETIDQKISELIAVLSSLKISVASVSNEVGLGIVPDNALSRRFRDFAGLLHQRYASVADNVYFLTAGIPQKIK